MQSLWKTVSTLKFKGQLARRRVAQTNICVFIRGVSSFLKETLAPSSPCERCVWLLPAQKGKKYMQTVSCEAAVGVAGLLWGCHLLTISHAGESWRLSCPFLSPLTGAVAIISQHSSHYTASNANCIFFLLFTYLTWDFFFLYFNQGCCCISHLFVHL